MSFVVLPSFEISDENRDAFLAAARADARQSVANEPGCQQFDVVIDRDASSTRVLFYEVYDDRAAFEHHLTTPHLAAFRDSLRLCTEGAVQFFDRLEP